MNGSFQMKIKIKNCFKQITEKIHNPRFQDQPPLHHYRTYMTLYEKPPTGGLTEDENVETTQCDIKVIFIQ